MLPAEIALASLNVSCTLNLLSNPSANPAIMESPHPTVFTASILGTIA